MSIMVHITTKMNGMVVLGFGPVPVWTDGVRNADMRTSMTGIRCVVYGAVYGRSMLIEVASKDSENNKKRWTRACASAYALVFCHNKISQ